MYSLVLSLLLSVNLGLSIEENKARGLTVGQLYRLNCPMYHLLKYKAVFHSIATWKVSTNLSYSVLLDVFLPTIKKQHWNQFQFFPLPDKPTLLVCSITKIRRKPMNVKCSIEKKKKKNYFKDFFSSISRTPSEVKKNHLWPAFDAKC